MISGDLLISLCGRSSRDVKLSLLQGEKKSRRENVHFFEVRSRDSDGGNCL